MGRMAPYAEATKAGHPGACDEGVRVYGSKRCTIFGGHDLSG